MPEGNSVLVFPHPNSKPACHICTDTTDYKVALSCRKCKQAYCTDHASRINPLYCEHCMLDVQVVETTFQRTEEEYDEDTGVVKTVKSPKATQINLAGVDWTFHTQAVAKLTDEELRLQLQFFKATISLLENELTQRKINKQTAIRLNSGVISAKTTEVRTVKTLRTKKPVDVDSLVEKIKRMGINESDLLAALRGLK